MPRKLAGFVLAACITVTPSLAQTTTELLQKAIYTQETEGNLDNAILIYRQIVNSAPSQRDVAAQAQFRLAQALLQKGDLTSAAQEFNKLARDYSDYRNLVSTLAAQNSKKLAVAVEATNMFLYAPTSALAEMTFDQNKPVNVTGKIAKLSLSNPVSAMTVDGPAWHIFALPSPADMIRHGFTKTALKPGDQVEVSGVLAAEGQLVDGALAARADLVTVNGNTVFDRSKFVASAGQPGWNVSTRAAELKTLKLLISNLQAHIISVQASGRDNQPEVRKTEDQIVKAQDEIIALQKAMAEEGPAQ